MMFKGIFLDEGRRILVLRALPECGLTAALDSRPNRTAASASHRASPVKGGAPPAPRSV